MKDSLLRSIIQLVNSISNQVNNCLQRISGGGGKLLMYHLKQKLLNLKPWNSNNILEEPVIML